MHELGVVFYVIEELENVAKENNLTKVEEVTIELGEVSTVVPHYLLDMWDWSSGKHEFLKGCKMNLERIPAVTYCEDCHKEYGTVEHGKTCPHCGSEHTYLLRGNEFNIKSINAY